MKTRAFFTIFAITIIFLITLSTSIVLFSLEKHMISEEIENSQADTARLLANICSEAMLTRDDFLVINHVNTMKLINPEILYSVFLDTKGRVLPLENRKFIEGREKDFTETGKLKVKQYNLDAGTPVTEYILPAVKDGRSFGTCAVGYSTGLVQKRMFGRLRRILTGIFIVSFCILITGIPLVVIFAGTFTGPVKRLLKGAVEIGNGNLEHTIVPSRIYELGKLADEFNNMTEKLRVLDEMKSSFVLNVSHELRSPLTYINNYFDLYTRENKEALSEKHREYFAIIRQNIERLSAFINQTLDLAKLQAGMMPFEMKNTNLYIIVSEVADFCKMEFKRKNITFSSDIPEDLPDVNADETLLKQVFMNLLGNALKFTPDNGRISVSCRHLKQKKSVETTVEDTGKGISRKDLMVIFDRFQQSKTTDKGTGLGLSIVKSIIEQHNGSIRAESVEGSGARFIFTLPVYGETK